MWNNNSVGIELRKTNPEPLLPAPDSILRKIVLRQLKRPGPIPA